MVLGADVLDGFYSVDTSLHILYTARVAAECGIDVRVVGFSWNANPSEQVIQAVKQMPGSVEFWLRDPVSHERFQASCQREARLGADIAFLLRPASDSSSVHHLLQWSEKHRASGAVLVGINVNALAFGIRPDMGSDGTWKAVISAYARSIERLLDEYPSIRVVLLPHDVRGKTSDREASTQLFGALSKEKQALCYLPSNYYGAAEAKAMVTLLDCVSSGRMHLLVASLGSGVPCGGIEYQGKLEGLMQHFGLRGVVMRPEDALNGGLYRHLEDLYKTRDERRLVVRDRLPHVLSLAAGAIG